jgi:very-short-patch-repair endonuclease/predicted Zn-ribbon and HTH transcriptional regulator
MRKTQEQFEDEINNKFNGEYTVLGKYINNGTKIKIRHNKCNNIWEVTPTNILNNRSTCPYCCKNPRYTTEMFKNKIKELTNNEYELQSEYINTKTNITLIHKKCGNKFELKPNDFISNGQRCPICTKEKQYSAKRKTNDTFLKEVFNLVGDEYTFLEKYVNNSTKIKVKHNKCNNEYSVTPIKFLSGRRCPYCKKSFGELKIKSLLEDMNINFIQEYRFDDCKYERTLPFDFYLPDKNICIEYDGEFHYSVQYYKDDLIKQQKRDNIKNEYCKNHNIKLIRISYKDKNNIESILKTYLN